MHMNDESSNRPIQLLQSRQNLYKHKNGKTYKKCQEIKCTFKEYMLEDAVYEPF